MEFRCSDDLDSAWLAAKPVIYPEDKPLIYTADGWADINCLMPKLAIETVMHEATYTKSPDWGYEHEWRIASFKRSTDTGNYTDYKFDLQDLSAIYFGPMISSKDRLSLFTAARIYPATKIWDTHVGFSRNLTFRVTDS